MAICNHRWVAPRGDAPNSVPVNHVCALPLMHHQPWHACSCKATTLPTRVVPDQPGVLEIACSAMWDAVRYCKAWGAKGPHACKYRPGHSGIHRCPCGSSHE